MQPSDGRAVSWDKLYSLLGRIWLVLRFIMLRSSWKRKYLCMDIVRSPIVDTYIHKSCSQRTTKQQPTCHRFYIPTDARFGALQKAPGLSIVLIFLYIQMDLMPCLISFASLGMYANKETVSGIMGLAASIGKDSAGRTDL
jgi:hypothetical protein